MHDMQAWGVTFIAYIVGWITGEVVARCIWREPQWQTVRETPVWDYQVHLWNGRRRIVRKIIGGHAPRDLGWLATGVWTPMPNPPA